MANRPKDTLAARDYAIQQWNKGNKRVDKRFNNIHVKSAKGNRILIYGDSSSSKNGRQVLGTVHRDYINHRYGQEGTTYNKNYGKATYTLWVSYPLLILMVLIMAHVVQDGGKLKRESNYPEVERVIAKDQLVEVLARR